ncbi:MAG: hypothetical protein GY710_10485 [Desulfobacteraceae bacterium]|nr:hypothetical protein [Desulfobacteraceae bacterium]
MTGKDQKKELKKLPPLTLALVIGSFVVVAAFIMGIVFPQYQRVEKVKDLSLSKTFLLEEQKKLFPLYAKASALSEVKFDPALPFRERKAISRDKIYTLSKVFGNLARENNMEFIGHSLDIGSLKGSSNLISMDLEFSGALFDFRNCLIGLVALPFFNSMETIKITTDQTNVKKYLTKIRISIDKHS